MKCSDHNLPLENVLLLLLLLEIVVTAGPVVICAGVIGSAKEYQDKTDFRVNFVKIEKNRKICILCTLHVLLKIKWKK